LETARFSTNGEIETLNSGCWQVFYLTAVFFYAKVFMVSSIFAWHEGRLIADDRKDDRN
jgi:hypothetical protein